MTKHWLGVLMAALAAVGWAAEPERLSQLLAQKPLGLNAYPLGAMWQTPEERARQNQEHAALLQALQDQHVQGRLNAQSYSGLNQVLQSLKPTGRVRLSAVNAKWLEANPLRDPIIQPQDTFAVGIRPDAVRVMAGDGAVCEVRHREGLWAADYVQACLSGQQGSWAWVVQPDGRVQKTGLRAWNIAKQDQPAPGAWLWVPNDGQLDEGFNLRWSKWLATQGVSSQVDAQSFPQFGRQVTPPLEPTLSLDIAGRGLEYRPTSNILGNVGLVNMPSARMREVGYFGLGGHSSDPYWNVNLFFQPLRDLEFGFRYVSIGYYKYGETYAGSQDYKDKNIDAKLRLVDETQWFPEVAVGMRDLGGTGLFSSEYLVGSKRYGRLDFSLGLAWGNMGGRGNLHNPLTHMMGQSYEVRAAPGVWGGLGNANWFKGPAAAFAGVEYQTPWNTVIKAEYDANNYKHEPFGYALNVKSPINVGMVYALKPGVDVSLAYERGTTWSAGLTLYTDFATLTTPKLTDPSAPKVTRQRPMASPNWEQTAQDIEQLTDWRVKQIYEEPSRVVVQAERTRNPSPQVRLDKALAVMHRDAPANVQTLEVQHVAAGSVLAVQTVERDAWVATQTEPARTMAAQVPEQPAYETKPTTVAGALARESKSYYAEPGLDFVNHNGGPDGFVLYQLSAALEMGLKLPADFEVRGLVRERLADNYDRYKYVAPSYYLPRVRTDLRKYFTTSRTTLTNLSVFKTQRLSESWYGAIYGGYFEEMFGGVGSEVLYRQPGSRWAVGVDANRVRQRNFAQDFGFREYQANTGHLTGYWQTPWEGMYTSVSMGQYLGGDKGATVALTKVFSNGATLGAYATKTNVSAQQFGEGSFDKGLFWSVPFDALLTSSSRFHAGFGWKPLFADAGAKLIRPVNLFGETFWLAPDANSRLPAVPPNREVIPDDRVEPYARIR